MKLKIEGIREIKGFRLDNPVVFDNEIIVLTGKNGSGKTRFLEGISNKSIAASIDGHSVNSVDIKVIPHASLIPSLGDSYNDTKYQAFVNESIALFDIVKDGIENDTGRQLMENNRREIFDGLNYDSLSKLCKAIAIKLNKRASELTHSEIKNHFELPSKDIFDIQSISTIINSYMKKSYDNDFKKWRSETIDPEIKYFTKKEFIENFGDKPWTLINDILHDTFDGKFGFRLPDENSDSFTYQAQLVNSNDDSPIDLNNLSSGEKTLLWLALAIFNSQYHNNTASIIPKILLMDEPDAFLHPKMVLKLYETLTSFKNKFNFFIIITTHSPTTVALAPNDSIYLVDKNTVNIIEKDKAISDLLDGVSQISVKPENRRQVFVESQYDANVYQSIYSTLKNRSKTIDPMISLNFISTGAKITKEFLSGKVKQILDINDEALITEFIESVNGSGNCVQVKSQVEALVEDGNDTVRGIIDWDRKNKPYSYITVLAENYAYSIENITLDPICILLLQHLDAPSEVTINDICGEDVHWTEWLKSDSLLQESINRFILKVFGRQSKNNATLKYFCGLELQTDEEYLIMNGHALENLVVSAYPKLNAYRRKGKDGELKYKIVERSMINFTNGDFIPSVYEEAISNVQK
ncbi:TPA: AAA family ATPase [Klebsiella pneumoniae]|uniref:ATP-binding protein n=1 Tax=Klebsiella pneumoniae TaxID=573 RepID=UPI0020C1DFF7|nr:ATP-binding protein [Klebsiella pneumoniae]HBR1446546.1 AAA family ATPase [Klebsiella quasipneumoniae subsp. quasipneumoniae]HEL4570468.1 AAA family ATPase [Klebsiella pneumoniae]